MRQEVADDLVAAARVEGRLAEEHRQKMNLHAGNRQRLIAGLHVGHHLSVRRIAALLGCSPAVVQKALRVAQSGCSTRR